MADEFNPALVAALDTAKQSRFGEFQPDMIRDKDFGVLSENRRPLDGLSLAEIEQRLRAEGSSQEAIDETLWLISETRAQLQKHGGMDWQRVQ